MLASDAKLEVWGDPIDHSLSPQIHSAAYAHLGLDWSFDRRRVGYAGFHTALGEAKKGLLGLALTMPLKKLAFVASEATDRAAALTGVVNTLVFGDRVHGYNTDVWGMVDALRARGVEHIAGRARVIGSGATAASAIVALAFLGAERIEVRARDKKAAKDLCSLVARLGLRGRAMDLSARVSDATVTVSTLPLGASLPVPVVTDLNANGGVLCDFAYGSEQPQLAKVWHPDQVVSGTELLLRQATRQIRVFVNGDVDQELADESVMLDRMREALVGD